MNSCDRNSEKGQAIVYLVLGLVVFLGFVALAIDGGMAMSNRRHGQNVADAAALAGSAAAAYQFEQYQDYYCDQPWACNVVPSADVQAYKQAIDRASANGFDIKRHDESPNHNYVELSCGGSTWASAYIDVSVDITATSPSNFLQLVYPDALKYNVQAVARAKPGGPYQFGNAVVALNPENCSDPGSQGVIVGGTGTLHVTGGNVFSNGCVRQNSPVSVTVDAPYTAKGHTLFHSEDWAVETEESIPPKEYEIKQPDCSTAPSDHIIDGKFLPDTLDPGLWCITGDVHIAKTVDGPGVTIVMLDGKLDIDGGATVTLSAPGINPNNYPVVNGAIKGLLLYVPKSNTNDITLNGNELSNFAGLLYAPASLIKMNGTGDNIYKPSQVVGKNVVIEGSGTLSLVYEGCNGYLMSPSVELYK